MNIKELLKRLTGISTPIGGVSWEPKPDEEKIIYNLLVELKDRRILSIDHGKLNKLYSINSLSKIRDSITDTLTQLPMSSSIITNLDNIRKVVSSLQTFIEHETKVDESSNIIMTDEIIVALNQIRTLVQDNLAFVDLQKNHNLLDKLIIKNSSELLKLK